MAVAVLVFAQVSIGGLACAQPGSDALEIVGLQYGFGGVYKAGFITPVEVTVRGGAENVTCHVELTVPDGDGYPTVVGSERPQQVLAGQTQRISLLAKPGRVSSTTVVTLVDAASGRVAARRAFDASPLPDQDHYPDALLSTQRLFVSLGPGIDLAGAAAIRARDLDRSVVVAGLEQAAQLPTRWFGLDGVDTIVLTTSEPELYRQLPADSPQWVALEQWVELGGQLVLCVGREAAEILAEGAPLRRFAPGTFGQVVPLRNYAPLEEYSEDQANPVPLGRGERGIEVAQLADVRGRVEVQAAGDLPLVVRTPYGFGQVVFVAFDLDDARLKGWRARDKFVARLVGLPNRPMPGDAENSPRLLHTQDLAAELRAGLDQFEGVTVAPFWLVAVLVLGYIALIGPGDYFFVRRVLKRMELTWITFPLIVVTVSVGAYVLARWMKGDELLMNQVDLVDIDLASGLTRGTSWTNVFSPTAEAYDVSAVPLAWGEEQDERAQTLVTWLGLPGSLLGGMNQSAGDSPLWSRPYRLTSQFGEMLGVPIQVWSTKSFATRWNRRYEIAELPLEADLRTGANQGVEGQITNRFEQPLASAYLVYGDWVYQLDEIAPGATFNVDARRTDRRTLRAALTRTADDEVTMAASAYYGGAVGDMNEVLRRMMFYGALYDEDTEYLVNRYQAFVDLSGAVTAEMGRAVLVAQMDRAGSELRLNGEAVRGPHDRHWQTYRFLLPVESAEPAR